MPETGQFRAAQQCCMMHCGNFGDGIDQQQGEMNSVAWPGSEEELWYCKFRYILPKYAQIQAIREDLSAKEKIS